MNVLEPASALARSPAGAGGLAGWDAEATGLALEREGMAEARALFNRMALRQGVSVLASGPETGPGPEHPGSLLSRYDVTPQRRHAAHS